MNKIVPIIIAGVILITAINAGAVPYVTGEPYMGDNGRIESSQVKSINNPNFYTLLDPSVRTLFAGSPVMTLNWDMYFNGSKSMALKLNWAIFNSRQLRILALNKMNRQWSLESWSLKAMNSWQPKKSDVIPTTCSVLLDGTDTVSF